MSTSSSSSMTYAPYQRRHLRNASSISSSLMPPATYAPSPLTQESFSPMSTPTQLQPQAAPSGLSASSSAPRLAPAQQQQRPLFPIDRPISRYSTPPPPLTQPQPQLLVSASSPSTSSTANTAAVPLNSFQPKGLTISRTAEFINARKKGGQANSRLEDGRLGRRLEKLLAIHHNPVPLSAAANATAKDEGRGSGDYDPAEEPLLALANTTASHIRKASSDLWATLRVVASTATTPVSSENQPQRKRLTLEGIRTKTAEDAARRKAEQAIVKWQEDAEAKACPICATPFSLAVRKHHCRLCGRVVCASPNLTKPIFPTLPNSESTADGTTAAPPPATDPIKAAALLAEQKCSGLIVLTDARTGKVDDARKVAAETAVAAASAEGVASELALKAIEKNVEERAVRICKDCRKVIFRQQYMLESGPVPTWVKLYEALVRLQREIEESLPEFHEMVLGLQKHDASTTLGSSARTTLKLQRDAASARKQLLANFAAYDALAKRIRTLPTPGSVARAAAAKMQANPGTTSQRVNKKFDLSAGIAAGNIDDPQERVQLAIWTTANLFLQKNMFPLQTLPKPESNGSASSSRSSTPANGTSTGSQKGTNGPGSSNLSESAAAAVQAQEQIVVLREQQHLLEDYMARAGAARKFEDAKMLKASWEELEREVEKLLVVASSNSGSHGSLGDPRRAANGGGGGKGRR
ncbi:carboxypeptidase Y-deficient [Tilletia horrida]|nr:carboxypeptidase Y-deficient [Tilletia horrida]